MKKLGGIYKGGLIFSTGRKEEIYLRRIRIMDSPYSCPMCRENSKDLLHFIALCPEL